MNDERLLAWVITVSDRCAAGVRPDESGPLLSQACGVAGYRTEVIVVPDGVDSVQAALRGALAAGARLILTTGGTGVGPRDHTPEATEALLDRHLPGIPELLRARGAEHARHAVLTRGVAGVAQDALIVNLPGNPGAAGEGIELVLPLVDHVLHQLEGGDH